MLVLLFVFILPAIIFLAIFLPLYIRNKKYQRFVKANSKAYIAVLSINQKYNFINIKDLTLNHTYDSETFYNNISCLDYLIYELRFLIKEVNKAITDATFNKEWYTLYLNEINGVDCYEQYVQDTEKLRLKKLNKIEKKLISKIKKTPKITFNIYVNLYLRNMAGRYKEEKWRSFDIKEIKTIINKLNQRRNGYYLDKDIWDAICRVERGKVTNRMRFAIYERDNYRCRMCGRRTDDLEIDHIIPISKGGKSTYDNLQTLCHRCNMRKGSDIY